MGSTTNIKNENISANSNSIASKSVTNTVFFLLSLKYGIVLRKKQHNEKYNIKFNKYDKLLLKPKKIS